MQKFCSHILVFLLAVTTNISAQNNRSEYSPAHRVYQWRVDTAVELDAGSMVP